MSATKRDDVVQLCGLVAFYVRHLGVFVEDMIDNVRTYRLHRRGLHAKWCCSGIGVHCCCGLAARKKEA